MIDKEMAYKMATEYINTYHKICGDTLVILDARTIEEEVGWIFFYQTKRGLETNMTRYKLVGNYPIIVDRWDGSIHYLDVENRINTAISLYKENRGKVIENYSDLDGFLECYMAKNAMGEFSTDESAIEYYITYAQSREVQEVIEQGKCLLKKGTFFFRKDKRVN